MSVPIERCASRDVVGCSTLVGGHECQRQAPARWPATLHRGGVPRVKTWQRALGRCASAGVPFGIPAFHVKALKGKGKTMSDNTANWSFETRQIHAGQAPDPTTGARALPIYQTTSYVFNDAEHAQNLFALKEFGNIYTRIMNQTQDAVEQRIASLEGGVAALLVASGQAVETIAILNVADVGDHIVASSQLYGGTYNLLKYTLKKLGIETTFVENPDDLESWRAAVKSNTKAFYAETISNPSANILDIEGVSAVAHEVGVPLIVDNTVATPYLIRPLEWGADVVVHSATKYLGGHGTSIAGVIVDGGTFDYAKDPARYPSFNEPDPSYNGLVYARDLGVGSPLGANLAYILKARVHLLRDLGPAISPFNAFLISQGVETLSLRIERHVENALKVATWLEAHSQVESVSYASLASSPWKALADKYAPVSYTHLTLPTNLRV